MKETEIVIFGVSDLPKFPVKLRDGKLKEIEKVIFGISDIQKFPAKLQSAFLDNAALKVPILFFPSL